MEPPALPVDRERIFYPEIFLANCSVFERFGALRSIH